MVRSITHCNYVQKANQSLMPAFDNAVISEPPFEAVIHTASPYHFHAKDVKELLNPGKYKSLGDV